VCARVHDAGGRARAAPGAPLATRVYESRHCAGPCAERRTSRLTASATECPSVTVCARTTEWLCLWGTSRSCASPSRLAVARRRRPEPGKYRQASAPAPWGRWGRASPSAAGRRRPPWACSRARAANLSGRSGCRAQAQCGDTRAQLHAHANAHAHVRLYNRRLARVTMPMLNARVGGHSR
jgi:hypothetical protein